MNKIFIIGLTLFFFMFSSLALAHPPTDIIFKFQTENKILSVGVTHSVKYPNKHFIKQINIKLNGKDWITQHFLSQTNPDVQAVSYAVVDLKKDDVIEITAICSESGYLTKTFKINKL